MQYPEPIAKLIDSYMKLPGIGEKTATRLAFYTLGMDQKDVEDFAKSLLSVKKDLHYCSICGFITEDDPCPICRDKSRDRSTILVVEHSQDIMAMEPWPLSCFARFHLAKRRNRANGHQHPGFA